MYYCRACGVSYEMPHVACALKFQESVPLYVTVYFWISIQY
jgi:hypothetical protein